MKWFLSLGVCLLLVMVEIGCNRGTGDANAQLAKTATPVASPSPEPSPTPRPPTAPKPVTLALLDACFANQKFAPELKAKLDLTDQQLEHLRSAAHAEAVKIRDHATDAAQSATDEGRAAADQQLATLIGRDKTEQLYTFVHEKLVTPGAELSAQTPNAVPTDTRIIVNVPAYRMDLFQDGNLIKTYEVGIGYPEFPLAVGLRKAEEIIFNPSWTPPNEPWVTGSNKVQAGKPIPPGSGANPLGPAKIPIGAPSLIHGGKAPSRIGTFASHGCVGLTTPQLDDFIPKIADISGVKVTSDEVARYAKNRTVTRDVKLGHSIPVELRYETIVVDNGKLEIYRDVYGYGTNSDENLRRVLAVYGVTLEQLSGDERAKISDALAEMAHDAFGKAIAPASSFVPRRSRTPATTRGMKGRRQIVLDIPELQGKGYPSPVDLSTGGAPSYEDGVTDSPKKKK